MRTYSRASRALATTLLAVLLGACTSPAPEQARVVTATQPPATVVPATSVSVATITPPATPLPQAPAATPTERLADPTTTPPPPTRQPESIPTNTAQPAGETLASRLAEAVQAGAPAVEIADPGLALPDDVHPKQIKKYFQVGELYVALVLRGSMNIYLDLSENGRDWPFAGVLVSDDGASWRKHLRVHDLEATAKNNPYYLWASDGQLALSIVDQNGAGSGEGLLKVARLSAAGAWQLGADCYYFSHGNPDEQGDYFAYSQYLARHEQRAAQDCGNVRVEQLP